MCSGNWTRATDCAKSFFLGRKRPSSKLLILRVRLTPFCILELWTMLSFTTVWAFRKMHLKMRSREPIGNYLKISPRYQQGSWCWGQVQGSSRSLWNFDNYETCCLWPIWRWCQWWFCGAGGFGGFDGAGGFGGFEDIFLKLGGGGASRIQTPLVKVTTSLYRVHLTFEEAILAQKGKSNTPWSKLSYLYGLQANLEQVQLLRTLSWFRWSMLIPKHLGMMRRQVTCDVWFVRGSRIKDPCTTCHGTGQKAHSGWRTKWTKTRCA